MLIDEEPPLDRSDSLRRLEERAAAELAVLSYPDRGWRPAPRDGLHDVVIVGAGQSGLSIAFALRRLGVGDVLLLDRAAAGREGPWTTVARMPTLRTFKHLTGPDAGVPSLAPRAWFTARFGEAAWERCVKLPTAVWAEYLAWFRRMTAPSVANGVELRSVAPAAGSLRLETLHHPSGRGLALHARKLVLATGMDGGGAWFVPPEAVAALDPASYAHTSEPIAFERLAGRRVAVVGAGASAFDAAVAARRAGAARVDILARRAVLERPNPYVWMEQAGFLAAYPDLDDATRWRMARAFLDYGQPPTAENLALVRADPGCALTCGCVIEGYGQGLGGRPRVRLRDGTVEADFLVFGTGSVTDLAARPELAGLADAVRLWRHAHAPPPGEEHEGLGAYPYLGRGFELTERRPGEAPHLRDVHVFNAAALPSMGLSGSAIGGLRFGVARLAAAIAAGLYAASAGEQRESLARFLASA